MQIGGSGALLGLERGKDALRLTELKAVEKVVREKFAYPEPGNTANKASTGNAQAFLARNSNGTSSVTHPEYVPTGGAQATLASSQTSQTLFYAQQIASTTPDASSPANSSSTSEAKSTSHKNAVEAYRDIVGKTPGERMRAQVLRSLGLTEEELRQLPPEERNKIEEQIAQLIHDKVKSSVVDGIAEKEGMSGERSPNGKGDSGFEQALIAQKSYGSGDFSQIQKAEKSDQLHKALMENIN